MRALTRGRYVRIGPLVVDLNRHVLLDLIYRCATYVGNSRLAFLWRRHGGEGRTS